MKKNNCEPKLLTNLYKKIDENQMVHNLLQLCKTRFFSCSRTDHSNKSKKETAKIQKLEKFNSPYIESEYDQEMPQSHTAEQPTASRGRGKE